MQTAASSVNQPLAIVFFLKMPDSQPLFLCKAFVSIELQNY